MLWLFAVIVVAIFVLPIVGAVLGGWLIVLGVLAAPFIYAYNKANQDN